MLRPSQDVFARLMTMAASLTFAAMARRNQQFQLAAASDTNGENNSGSGEGFLAMLISALVTGLMQGLRQAVRPRRRRRRRRSILEQVLGTGRQRSRRSTRRRKTRRRKTRRRKSPSLNDLLGDLLRG